MNDRYYDEIMVLRFERLLFYIYGGYYEMALQHLLGVGKTGATLAFFQG